MLGVRCECVEWGAVIRCVVSWTTPHCIQGCAGKIADAASSYIGAVAGVAIFIALALVSPTY